MVSEEVEILIQKYLEGDLDDQQIHHLAEKVSNEEVKKVFVESIEINYLLTKKFNNLDANEAYSEFISKINDNQEPTIHRIKPLSWLKYAAVLVAVIGIAAVLMLHFSDEVQVSSLQQPSDEITLEYDGGLVELAQQNRQERVINKGGIIKIKQIGDRIVYKDDSDIHKIIYNTLNIPNGRTFQIQLSDGTLVYLNSGTRLKYPVKFLPGEKREVFIYGEAYFKVAEDKEHPFVVNVNDMQIEVLGTEFNVSNYEEYDAISTVLVTGGVKFTDVATKKSLNMKPGHMAVWDKNVKTFDLAKVDVHNYTGWIDGKLIFKDMPFKTIRIKLEKHYNVTIKNNNKELDGTTFNASFDIESIEEVIETFKRNFGIDYNIVDNQIIIN